MRPTVETGTAKPSRRSSTASLLAPHRIVAAQMRDRRQAMADGLTAAQVARAVGKARSTLYCWEEAPQPRSRRHRATVARRIAASLSDDCAAIRDATLPALVMWPGTRTFSASLPEIGHLAKKSSLPANPAGSMTCRVRLHPVSARLSVSNMRQSSGANSPTTVGGGAASRKSQETDIRSRAFGRGIPLLYPIYNNIVYDDICKITIYYIMRWLP